MKENGTMNWLAQICQMKNRDIRTIEQSELQELPQDAVEHGLPQEERLKNLLDKVRNPYCYLDNGIIVKLNFAKTRRKISHFNTIKHWTKDDDSGKLFTGKKIGMCQLSRTCSVGLFYIENVEPFTSLTNSIADSLRRWKAFVIP